MDFSVAGAPCQPAKPCAGASGSPRTPHPGRGGLAPQPGRLRRGLDRGGDTGVSACGTTRLEGATGHEGRPGGRAARDRRDRPLPGCPPRRGDPRRAGRVRGFRYVGMSVVPPPVESDRRTHRRRNWLPEERREARGCGPPVHGNRQRHDQLPGVGTFLGAMKHSRGVLCTSLPDTD